MTNKTERAPASHRLRPGSRIFALLGRYAVAVAVGSMTVAPAGSASDTSYSSRLDRRAGACRRAATQDRVLVWPAGKRQPYKSPNAYRNWYEPAFANPIVRQRADPHITLHRDGWYYFTATVPEYDRLELRRAKAIPELGAAEPKVIWRRHATGPMGSHIWAPELHFIGGKWYVYFAAGGAEKDKVWEIRIYVLENPAANPLDGEWRERGQLKTNWESFALDATTFVHRGTRYLAWAQKDPAIRGNTNLYLAGMDSPASIAGRQVLLSKPEYAWERVRFWVNEGPAVIVRNGRVFMTYSAAGTGAEYCLGLLTADAEADLLDPGSWTKSPEPVFTTHEENGVFGPGHNSFTTTPDGGTDLLVYHARSYRDIKGDPLHDPNRHTRVQPLSWRADGTPDFGAPRADARPPE